MDLKTVLNFFICYFVILIIIINTRINNDIRIFYNFIFYCHQNINSLYIPDSIYLDQIPKLHLINVKYINLEKTGNYLRYLSYEPSVLNIGCFKNNSLNLLKKFEDYVRYVNLSLYTISNCYVYYDGSISIDGHRISSHKNTKLYKYSNGTITNIIDKLIVINSAYANHIWGHLIIDVCYPLMLLKEKYISSYYILLPGIQLANDIFIDIFGFSKDQLISLHPNEWIFCNRIISFLNPTPFLSIYFTSISFKQKIAKIYCLNSIKAEKFCYNNRKPSQTRHIPNMKEIIFAIESTYAVHFQEILDIFPSFRENANVFASIKLLFCPAGSGVIRGCFMKDNSVILSPCGYDWSPTGVANDCMANKIFFLQYKGEFAYYRHSNKNISIENTLKFFSKALYCVKYSKWPSTNEIKFFNN